MCSMLSGRKRVAKTYGLRTGAICLFLGFARHATVDDPSQSRHPASGIRSPWTYVSYQEIRNNSRRIWRQSCFCNIQQRLCGSISLRGAIQVSVTTTTTTNTYIHETITCMTIQVLWQYLEHNTCFVLQYVYCVISPQCVPSLRYSIFCVLLTRTRTRTITRIFN